MCEITIDNFDSKLSEITYNLQKANFIAIDLEFSGMHLEQDEPSLKDSADQRYIKLKKAIQLFSPLQIGLSTFRHDSEQRCFVSDSYNFFLFPRNYGINLDLINSFQTSSVEFLSKYEFDFNKLIYKGIPYMNSKQEKALEAKLRRNYFNSVLEKETDEKNVQRVCSEITDWLLRASIGDFHEVTSKACDLPDFILHKELRNRFESIWTHQNGTKIVVERISGTKRVELENSDPNDTRKMINLMLGFTRIFRLIVQFKKPLIFHNGFMDILFLYEKFYEPLPETFGLFKNRVNNMFPLMYDTKLISLEIKKIHAKEMKEFYDSTVLEHLYNCLQRESVKKAVIYMPNVKHSQNSFNYGIKSCPHEAGFDAHMTGLVFLKLAHILASLDSKSCFNIRPNNMNDYFLAMKAYENKTPLMNASLSFINFSGPNPPCTNTKVLFVESTRRAPLSGPELVRIFSNYGTAEVEMNSRNSAFVTVECQSSAIYIETGIKSNHKHLVIKPYSFWKHSKYSKILGVSALAAASALLILAFNHKKLANL
jgi:hypothetical protein